MADFSLNNMNNSVDIIYVIINFSIGVYPYFSIFLYFSKDDLDLISVSSRVTSRVKSNDNVTERQSFSQKIMLLKETLLSVGIKGGNDIIKDGIILDMEIRGSFLFIFP